MRETVKRITDPDEIWKIVPVIRSAWGMEDMSSLVKDVVAAMRFHGGIVLGAYDGDRMVGMHFSFPGYRKGRVYLYSHMTGVVDERKYSGIGYALKMEQARIAREMGYSLIAWTFDPAMSLNAYFNLHKLGAIARTYLPNFYGTMEDRINRGMKTDRLVAEWYIGGGQEFRSRGYTIENMEDGRPARKPVTGGEDTIGLAIPTDFAALKERDRTEAVAWRQYIGSTLSSLFNQGYVAVDFGKEPVTHYILTKTDELGENIFRD
ncbi:hypothetical protein [Thermogymnomonas acidicola]|nr:hypothetical protein [Thermogymnomonas acidicola]